MAKQSQEPWFLIRQRILVGDVPQKSPGVTFGLIGLASIALGFIVCPPIPWGATAISITLSVILTIRKRLTWSNALFSTSASPLFQKEGPKRSEDYFIAQDEHATDTSDNCRNNMPGLNVHDLVRKFKDFTDKLFTLAPCIISNLYRLYY